MNDITKSQNTEIELTMGDIKAVLDIITAMSARGAIKANELLPIGSIYNKYLSILETFQKKDTSKLDTSSDS